MKRNKNFWSYRLHKLGTPKVLRTDRRTDGQTDGQTDGRSGLITRPAFAKATQVTTTFQRLESRFKHSDNQKYFTWVFIRMCVIVTSSDITSFVYIGDEKHHLSKWLGKEKK